MSYSTNDCKKLLDQHPDTAGTNQGAWKRLSKRKAPDGVERIFSDSAGGRFVRILESPDGLVVVGVGNSRAEVDATGEGKPVTRNPASPGGGTLHKAESDPAKIALAEEIMTGWLNHQDVNPESPRFEKAGLALANCFHFGIAYMEEEGECWAMFMPKSWADAGEDFIPDFEPPIGHLLPHPEMSESPNGSCDWIIGGFNDDVKGAIRALLDRGFVWDERLQEMTAKRLQNDDNDWVSEWVRNGARDNTKKAKVQKTATENDFPQINTAADLEKVLASQKITLLFLPHSNISASPEFWWELRKLGAQCGLPLSRIVPGSEVAQAIEKVNGPTRPDRWHFPFFQGNQRSGMEDMFSGLFHQLVQRHFGRGSKPKP